MSTTFLLCNYVILVYVATTTPPTTSVATTTFEATTRPTTTISPTTKGEAAAVDINEKSTKAAEVHDATAANTNSPAAGDSETTAEVSDATEVSDDYLDDKYGDGETSVNGSVEADNYAKVDVNIEQF